MRKTLVIITLVSISLFACGGNDKSTLKISDPQQPIVVGTGEEFNIVLESNPTTGYHWDIVGELDRNVVEFVKSEYTSTSDPNLVGGGGVEVWTFKAVSAGETQVTLGYYPPSNDPVDPQQTTTFTVTTK
jgi:inhibitor of cysteine peptidase